jgi:glycosyltransferase involved in cell wall biosynthesis
MFHSNRLIEEPRASNHDAAAPVPLITVAIPHYKQRRYLEVVLESLFEQTTNDFEILVSDDCSPDDSNVVIPKMLEASGRSFRYYSHKSNLGYDGNVRFCLSAARGRYVFLLGNDDALATPQTLSELAKALAELQFPEVAFTSYEDWKTGRVVQRAQKTTQLGSGPAAALKYFRTFSFVSGLIFEQRLTAKYETDRWDSSIYYQIYMAAKILAGGGLLGSVAISAVRKDVLLNGQTVETYATRAAKFPWSFQSRHTGLDSVIRVTADALFSSLPAAERSRAVRRIAGQILRISYPFWLFEYRRVGNWSSAVGVARGMWPSRLLAEYDIKAGDYLYLWALYLGVTLVGLTFPALLFNRMRATLSNLVRRRQQTPVILAPHVE